MSSIHWIQHVPFEGLGAIETWAAQRDHQLHAVALHAGDALPQDPQALIVMGGPMGVGDRGHIPWMEPEIALIRHCLERGVPVLGICLGAQLMAAAAGAAVYRGPAPEIGWWPIAREESCHPWARILPAECVVCHWHGDTFDLPPGAQRLARSAAVANQIVAFGPHALGLQCHLETTKPGLDALIDADGGFLVPGPWVQDVQGLRDGLRNAEAMHAVLYRLLDAWLGM